MAAGAQYDQVPTGPDSQEGKYKDKEGPQEPVQRLSSRAELHEDEEEGTTYEIWHFDQDAYSVALTALHENNLPGALPSVALGLVVASVQLFICLQVMVYLLTHNTPPDSWLSVQVVCSFLCLLQVSDEAVEGLHKLIFCLRWYLGIYSGQAKVSALVGCLLSVLQLISGVFTCVMNIQVIFSCRTILDTFFNFVALAFIADIDNILVNSRIVRSLKECPGEIQVRWACEEKLEKARGMGLWVSVTTTLVVWSLLVCSYFTFFGEVIELSHQVHFKDVWPGAVCRGFFFALSGNALLWAASRWLGVCYASGILSGIFFVLLMGAFLMRVLAEHAGEGGGCSLFSIPVKIAFEVFLVLLMPVGLSVHMRPFFAFRVIPLQIKAVMLSSLAYIYEIRRWGC